MCNKLMMASSGMVEVVGNSSASFAKVEMSPDEGKSQMAWSEGSQSAVGAIPASGGSAAGAVPVVGCTNSGGGGGAATPPVSGGGKVVTASAPKKSASTTGAQIAAKACG